HGPHCGGGGPGGRPAPRQRLGQPRGKSRHAQVQQHQNLRQRPQPDRVANVSSLLRKQLMPLDLVETLRELVAIPSVNPMGRPVSGPEYFEYRVTDYLQGLFERLGLPWQRQYIEPKRENIIVRVDGEVPATEGGPLILFEAHQDTVPVDNMIIDPWDPVVRDGRVYGRGSCDIKGGMAAMLGALARLAAEPREGRPTVVLACTVNEEHGYSGAAAL